MEEQTLYHIMADEIVTCTYSVYASSPKEAVDKLLSGNETVYLKGEEGQGYFSPIPFAVYEVHNYAYDNMTYFDTDGNECEQS